MKKFNKVLILAISTMTFNVFAEHSSISVSQYSGDFIENAGEFVIKYEADLGGYAYAKYNEEKAMDAFAQVDSKTIEVGLGVKEAWDRDAFPADVYIGVGYYSTQYNVESLINSENYRTNYNGLNYHIGIEMHPFSENLDIIAELQHNGAGQNPLNEFNGVLVAKKTRGWFGVGFNYDDFNLGIKVSSDDIIKASITFKY